MYPRSTCSFIVLSSFFIRLQIEAAQIRGAVLIRIQPTKAEILTATKTEIMTAIDAGVVTMTDAEVVTMTDADVMALTDATVESMTDASNINASHYG